MVFAEACIIPALCLEKVTLELFEAKKKETVCQPYKQVKHELLLHSGEGKKQQVNIFTRNVCVGLFHDTHTNKMATKIAARPSMENIFCFSIRTNWTTICK